MRRERINHHLQRDEEDIREFLRTNIGQNIGEIQIKQRICQENQLIFGKSLVPQLENIAQILGKPQENADAARR